MGSFTIVDNNGIAARQAITKTTLVNYTKAGRAFVHQLSARRIQDEDTGREYYMTESREVTCHRLRRSIFNRCLKTIGAKSGIPLEKPLSFKELMKMNIPYFSFISALAVLTLLWNNFVHMKFEEGKTFQPCQGSSQSLYLDDHTLFSTVLQPFG